MQVLKAKHQDTLKYEEIWEMWDREVSLLGYST